MPDQEKRIEELEDDVAELKAGVIALMGIVQVLVARADAAAFSEIVEFLDIPTLPPNFGESVVDKCRRHFEERSLSFRKRRRHVLNLQLNSLGPESSDGGTR